MAIIENNLSFIQNHFPPLSRIMRRPAAPAHGRPYKDRCSTKPIARHALAVLTHFLQFFASLLQACIYRVQRQTGKIDQNQAVKSTPAHPRAKGAVTPRKQPGKNPHAPSAPQAKILSVKQYKHIPRHSPQRQPNSAASTRHPYDMSYRPSAPPRAKRFFQCTDSSTLW